MNERKPTIYQARDEFLYTETLDIIAPVDLKAYKQENRYIEQLPEYQALSLEHSRKALSIKQ